MSSRAYLEAEPLSEIQRWHGNPKESSVAFVGTLRKHPYDQEKCLLISDPAELEPAIYEFRVADIVAAEELASPVDLAGTSRSLARLWVRRGSVGVRYEPFEVDDPIRPAVSAAGFRPHQRTEAAMP